MELKNSTNGCAARTPQVSEQVQRLEKAIEHLAEVRSNLDSRLGLVLMPCTLECDKQPLAPRAQMVPLAEEIDRLTEQVNGVRISMESMLSRIEL